jgi:hypothetical protein
MAANSLAASYTDLQGEVALAAGWHRTIGSWSSTNTADFARINEDALRQAYFPEPLMGERTGHVWSFLRPRGSITLNGSYATGTIEVAPDVGGAIVTLTGGTWPSWAASADLWVDGERYEVDSRSSNTVIVLDSITADTSSGQSYELIQHAYDLPTDFGGMNSDGFKVRRDQREVGFIPLWTPGDAEQADWASGGEGLPTKAAVVPVSPTSTTDSQWQAIFTGPMPRDDLRLEFRYKAIPPLLDGSSHVYHYGGAPFSRMFIASYVDIAYQKIRGSFEKREAFLTALRQAVMYDRQMNAPHTFGAHAKSVGASDVMARMNSRRAQSSYTMDDLT